jgi:hypothetical protein
LLVLWVALVASSGCGKAVGPAPAAQTPTARFDGLANLPFTAGFLSKEGRTLPGKGFFVILRLYGPTKAFFDQRWKPSDIERVEGS